MGAYLSKPVTDLKSDDLSKNGQYECGVSGMQGWRISMEDAHNCIPSLDDDTGLFSVYDGHGGGEVAMYCSHHFGGFLKERDSYKNGHYEKALIETFMHIDNILKEPQVIKELKILNQKDPWDPPLTELDFEKYDEEQKQEESTEEEETKLLYEEATMNIEDLLAKYGQAVNKTQEVLDAKLNPGKSKNQESLEEIDITDNSKTAPNKNKNNSTESSKLPDQIQNECGVARKPITEEIVTKNSSEENSLSAEAKDPVSKKAKFVKVKPNKMEKDENEESDDDDYEDFESDEAQEGSSDEDDIDEEDLSEEEEEEQEEDLSSCAPGMGSGVEEPGSDSGTTAVVALLKGTQLYVANAGDSRCVLSRKGGVAFDMSDDHKPEDEKELNRIQTAGGHVNAQGRVNGGLNLSRAIGDHCYKTNKTLPLEEQMISALPDVRSVKLEQGDEFMVLACDGIWNVFSSQQVVDFVRERLHNEDKSEKDTTLSKICEELFNKCLAPDTMGDGTGCDNMTAMIIKFNQDWIQSHQTRVNCVSLDDTNNGNTNNNISDDCNNIKEKIGDGNIKEAVNKFENNKRPLDIDANVEQTLENDCNNLPAKRLKVE